MMAPRAREYEIEIDQTQAGAGPWVARVRYGSFWSIAEAAMTETTALGRLRNQLDQLAAELPLLQSELNDRLAALTDKDGQ